MVWVHVTLATVTWLDRAVGGGGGWPAGAAGGRGAGAGERRAELARAGARRPHGLVRSRAALRSLQLSDVHESQHTPSPASGARSADASLIILVVDDESDLREMLTRSFSREGHRVMAVGDGRSAIDRASTDHFDIILLDVALGPGPDGYEVCRTLRARRNVVPIIMLTALDSEADAVLGLEAGRGRLRDQAVRPGRAAQPDPGRAAARRHARDGRRGAGGRSDRARPRPARGHHGRAARCG